MACFARHASRASYALVTARTVHGAEYCGLREHPAVANRMKKVMSRIMLSPWRNADSRHKNFSSDSVFFGVCSTPLSCDICRELRPRNALTPMLAHVDEHRRRGAIMPNRSAALAKPDLILCLELAPRASEKCCMSHQKPSHSSAYYRHAFGRHKALRE